MNNLNTLVSRLLRASLLGGGLLLVVMVSGCGVTSTLGSGSQRTTTSSPGTGTPTRPSPTTGSIASSTAQLACDLKVTVRPIDSIGETLHCTVSHMPSSQTTFVLHYTVQNNAGKSTVMAPPCQGALSGGAGSCTAILSSPLPQIVTRGVVSGSTQPNQYPLGPIVPKQVAGSTPIGTPLPFQPRG